MKDARRSYESTRRHRLYTSDKNTVDNVSKLISWHHSTVRIPLPSLVETLRWSHCWYTQNASYISFKHDVSRPSGPLNQAPQPALHFSIAAQFSRPPASMSVLNVTTKSFKLGVVLETLYPNRLLLRVLSASTAAFSFLPIQWLQFTASEHRLQSCCISFKQWTSILTLIKDPLIWRKKLIFDYRGG